MVTEQRKKMEAQARKQEKALVKQREREDKLREREAKKKAAKQPASLFTPGFLSMRTAPIGTREEA